MSGYYSKAVINRMRSLLIKFFFALMLYNYLGAPLCCVEVACNSYKCSDISENKNQTNVDLKSQATTHVTLKDSDDVLHFYNG